MKKLTKILSSISLFTALSVASYATDLHLSLEAGALVNVGSSYSKMKDEKVCANNWYGREECVVYNNKAADDYQPEKQRSSFAPYLNLQLGTDLDSSDPTSNVTLYIDYSWLNEFGGKLSHTGMYGIGATKTKKSDDSSLSYLGGIELHTASFDLDTAEGVTALSYRGFGATLSGGVLINNLYTVKGIFMHNSYTLSNENLDYFLPKEVSTNSLGVSVGAKFQ